MKVLLLALVMLMPVSGFASFGPNVAIESIIILDDSGVKAEVARVKAELGPEAKVVVDTGNIIDDAEWTDRDYVVMIMGDMRVEKPETCFIGVRMSKDLKSVETSQDAYCLNKKTK